MNPTVSRCLSLDGAAPKVRAAMLGLIEENLRVLADALALRDWNFVVSPEPCAPQFNAQIEPVFGRKLATLRVRADFLCLTPHQQRHSLTHELLHCHLAPTQAVAREVLPKRALGTFTVNLEYGVDGLADAVAPLLPLP
jgi:hypothetical protein